MCRRTFTEPEIELLLARDYREYSTRFGVTMSTARRYGHLVRHSEEYKLKVEQSEGEANQKDPT